MKKTLLVLILIINSVSLFAYDRAAFDKEQQRQENIIQLAFSNGNLTQNEYNKLIRQQEIIKEAIEDADLDHHWTKLEYDEVNSMLKKAAKKVNRYQRNREQF